MPDMKTNGKHAIRVALEWATRLTEAQRLGLPRDTFKELRDEYVRTFTRAVDLDSYEAAPREKGA
jgi:hypothetical protein